MTKAKVILVLAFIVVCAAGAVVGTAVDRHVRPPEERGGLGQLDLTDAQREKMKEIWNPVVEQRGQMFHKRHELDQQRSEAVVNLLTPEQKTAYDQLQRDFDRQNKELEDQNQQLVQSAEQQMRSILTPQQLNKMDEMRKKMPHGMSGPGMGPPGMGVPGMGPPHFRHDHRHAGTRPSTQPANAP